MKYYINYTAEGKILGFAQGETDLNVELSNSVWFEAMNGGYNKIIIDGENIGFDKVDWRTEEEIQKQIEDNKWAQFDTEWENLKIGYSTTLKSTFQVKNGSELGVNYDADTLYNVDTLIAVESTDHVYSCSKKGLSNLTQEKELLSSIVVDYWREPWGYFETNVIEISSIFLAIAPIKKQLISDLFGEVQ